MKKLKRDQGGAMLQRAFHDVETCQLAASVRLTCQLPSPGQVVALALLCGIIDMHLLVIIATLF
jgi:hypothetical protein